MWFVFPVLLIVAEDKCLCSSGLNDKPLWTVFEGEVTASFILAKLKKK